MESRNTTIGTIDGHGGTVRAPYTVAQCAEGCIAQLGSPQATRQRPWLAVSDEQRSASVPNEKHRQSISTIQFDIKHPVQALHTASRAEDRSKTYILEILDAAPPVTFATRSCPSSCLRSSCKRKNSDKNEGEERMRELDVSKAAPKGNNTAPQRTRPYITLETKNTNIAEHKPPSLHARRTSCLTRSALVLVRSSVAFTVAAQ